MLELLMKPQTWVVVTLIAGIIFNKSMIAITVAVAIAIMFIY